MKILTKEQEAAHYNETLKGGTLGGIAGLGVGLVGVWGASRRYHFIRTLTLPLKAFLVTSSGSFAAIIAADHWSRAYEQKMNPKTQDYLERQRYQQEAELAGKTFTERAMDWGRKERYKIVGASWLASMAAAFSIVNRDKYLTGAQKIVQARVYAQFLTLGVLVASAAFEISDSRQQQGRWETVKYIDPNDPEHKRILEKQVEKTGSGGIGGEKEDRAGRNLWKDMVQAEEDRIKEREEEEKRYRKQIEKKQAKKNGNGNGNGNGSKKEKKEDEEEDDDEEKKDKKS